MTMSTSDNNGGGATGDGIRRQWWQQWWWTTTVRTRCGGAAANLSVKWNQQQESDESDLVFAPEKWFVIVSNDDKMITERGIVHTHSCRVAEFFLNAQTHEKRTTKTSRDGTKMSCDGLTLGKINFWIHSKSSFTFPATCFECYDGTGTEMGRRHFQQWVGCNLGT